jgi:hypothetical protein
MCRKGNRVFSDGQLMAFERANNLRTVHLKNAAVG